MIFNAGNYELDIDIEKTKKIYMNAFPITAGCDCPGCRNYGKWATSFDTELKRILARMFELSSNYQVAFTDEIALVGEGFPTPVIQMEILAKIPWVLQGKCVYLN